jgi:hypothetical protein
MAECSAVSTSSRESGVASRHVVDEQPRKRRGESPYIRELHHEPSGKGCGMRTKRDRPAMTLEMASCLIFRGRRPLRTSRMKACSVAVPAALSGAVGAPRPTARKVEANAMERGSKRKDSERERQEHERRGERSRTPP